MIKDSGERTATELMNEIDQAIAKIGEELGAEMIVHCSVSVGAKKEIGGKTFGDYVILPDILDEDEDEDEDWRTTLDRFKTRMKIYFGIEQDEEQNKEGGEGTTKTGDGGYGRCGQRPLRGQDAIRRAGGGNNER